MKKLSKEDSFSSICPFDQCNDEEMFKSSELISMSYFNVDFNGAFIRGRVSDLQLDPRKDPRLSSSWGFSSKVMPFMLFYKLVVTGWRTCL
jgi:hypothetical protein